MRIAVLDGDAISTREELHAALARELALPDWYGGNLDALYDCLTDLGEETALRVVHREALEEKLGPTARGLMRVLADAEAENPWLRVEH